MSDKAQFTINENYPADGDGCSVRSWRCQKPTKDEMEKGRYQVQPEEVRKECKRCPVCLMIFCKYHMKESSHMEHCSARSNEERELLQEQREQKAIEDKKRKDDESRLAKVKAELEEKERQRRKNIDEHNRKHQGLE